MVWREGPISPSETIERAAVSSDWIVVESKLHIPAVQPERRVRPELLDALQASRGAKLVLVAAPAGSGKTTLLSNWCASPLEDRPFAWLSLDEQDNDEVRFWSCVLAALRTVVPGFGESVVAALRAPGADMTGLVLPLVVNELAAAQPLVLVLDDYHVVANEVVHRSLQFLVDHLPRTAQVAVASRSDPPLALPRLRARGEMVEVRAGDLRLTDGQAATLLNDGLDLGLDGEEISQLQARTEGWAAALQLVGLSLKGRTDRREYIASFAGDDRQIVDYVGAEVLDRQTPELRQFLLRTSILDRLNAELADAVTAGSGSGRLLGELERANLFLVPLDARREWYRYHHLFADLLRYELQIAEPELVAPLHRRAHEWLSAHGFVPEAIRHAIAAGDVAVAAELIAANWLPYVNSGQLHTVEAWTSALPAGAADADPRLCLARAWMLLVLGRPGEVEAAVRAAERGTLPGPLKDGSRSIEASAAMVRTSARLLLGDVSGASETAALAADLDPDPDSPWRPIVTNAQGMTAFWSGRTQAAVEAFEETVRAAGAVENHTARIYALGYLAVIAAGRGEVRAAEALVEEALDLARRQHLGEHWVAAMVHYGAAEVGRASGELEAAAGAFERGLALAERGGLRLDTAYGLLGLSRVRRALGNDEESRELLARARSTAEGCSDPGILVELLRSGGAAISGGRPRPRPSGELTARELAVLRLLPGTLSLREIAAELYVSLNTVKTQVRSVYAKLGVGARSEAVARARELGLL